MGYNGPTPANLHPMSSPALPPRPPLRQIVGGEVRLLYPDGEIAAGEHYTLYPRTDWLRIILWSTALVLAGTLVWLNH